LELHVGTSAGSLAPPPGNGIVNWRIESLAQTHARSEKPKEVKNGKQAMKPQAIPLQELGNNLNTIFDRIVLRHEVFSVQKSPGQAIVMLDAAEYAGLIETLYLLSNPANAARLRAGTYQSSASPDTQARILQAGEQLAAMGGTEPQLEPIPRRREEVV
jgi:antitoxin YefM